MFEGYRARKRHHLLMRAAFDIVGALGAAPTTPADLVSLAFGRHRIEIDEEEADRYMRAARVERGNRYITPATATGRDTVDDTSSDDGGFVTTVKGDGSADTVIATSEGATTHRCPVA
ncbi:hypothetical protein ACFYWP_37190 [Actinacidiphila glaucinigra]|uniref:hypothetical protein n=1 Tax=Actinacidiphila glaucinigra TaxID=235986 RepID=UPI0036754559